MKNEFSTFYFNSHEKTSSWTDETESPNYLFFCLFITFLKVFIILNGEKGAIKLCHVEKVIILQILPLKLDIGEKTA